MCGKHNGDIDKFDQILGQKKLLQPLTCSSNQEVMQGLVIANWIDNKLRDYCKMW